MAEQQEQAPTGQAPVTVNAQYIKDLSFENPNAPQSLVPQESAPNVEVNINVEAKKLQENTYEVVLAVNAEAKSSALVNFLIECSYAGIFTLSEVPEEHHQAVLMIEAPRLLFPFAREVVADATRNGGFPPLLINPIDFAAMYQQNANKVNASAGNA